MANMIRLGWACAQAMLIAAMTGCGGGGGGGSVETAPTQQSLSVQVSGSGAGTGVVASNPTNINCPGSCSGSFATGANVVLTATPTVGATFTGWSGACTGVGLTCNLTMDQSKNVTAAFSGPSSSPSLLTVTAAASSGAVQLGNAVEFNSSAGAGAGLRFDWEFGDGSSSTVPQPRHVFDRFGRFDVVLRLRDSGGAESVARLELDVPPWPHLKSDQCLRGASGGWCRLAGPSASPVEQQLARGAGFASTSSGYTFMEGRLWRTQDLGLTWQAVSPWVPGATERAVVVSGPAAGWITGSSDWYRFEDGGRTVRAVKPPAPDFAYDIQLLKNDVLLATPRGNVGLVWVSEDLGVSFRSVPVGRPASPAATAAGVIWRIAGDRVERSQDLGKSFEARGAWAESCPTSGSGTPSLWVLGEDILAVLSVTVYLDVQIDYLCMSFDAGSRWVARPVRLPDGRQIPSFSFAPQDGTAISSRNGLLFVLTPEATTWATIDAPPGCGWVSRYGALDSKRLFVICHVHLSALLSAGGTPGTYVTLDGGVSWKFLRDSERDSSPVAREFYGPRTFTQLNPSVWIEIVPTIGGTPRISEDTGTTWRTLTIAQPETFILGGRFIDARQGFALVVSRGIAQAMTTQDGGQSWQPVAGADIPAAWLWHADSDGMWLSPRENSGELWVSRDAGRSWAVVQRFDGRIQSLHGRKGMALALVAGGRIYHSTDQGRTWDATHSGLPEDVEVFVQNADALWLVRSAANCVQSSADAGKTWTACASPDVLSRPLKISVQHDQVWLASDGSGALESYRSGQLFRYAGASGWQVVAPLPVDSVEDIRFVDATRGWLIGSLLGFNYESDYHGVWATRDGGMTWTHQVTLDDAVLSDTTLNVIDESMVWVFGTRALFGTATGGY